MRSARGLLGRTLVPFGGCETPGSAHDQLGARCALKHAVSLRAPAGTCLRAVAPCARASRCPGRSRESATCACASRETRCHAARAEPPGRLLQPPPREPNGESHAQTRPDPRRSAYAPAGLFVCCWADRKSIKSRVRVGSRGSTTMECTTGAPSCLPWAPLCVRHLPHAVAKR